MADYSDELWQEMCSEPQAKYDEELYQYDADYYLQEFEE